MTFEQEHSSIKKEPLRKSKGFFYKSNRLISYQIGNLFFHYLPTYNYNSVIFMFENEIAYSLHNADILFIEHFFDETEADALFKELIDTTAWQQGEITIFGKKVLEPRLTAWYGDAGKAYKYSGKTNIALAWNAPLLQIKHKIEEKIPPSRLSRDVPSVFLTEKPFFNSVLLNLYRNGTDSMGFHSDDEPELGKNPVIASVNFGESRRFIFRRKDDKTVKHELLLTHGSLLIMAGEMQHYWQHGVPKELNKTKPRINLTFRTI